MKYDTLLNDFRAVAQDRQPENNISEFLSQHKCFYMLSKVKDSNIDKFSAQFSLNQLVISNRYKVCEQIFEKLNLISYAVIKGAVLSEAAYGNVAYRKSGDIDILVCRDDIDYVKSIILSNGFIQGKLINNEIVPFTRKELIFQSLQSHQTAPFLKKTESFICPFVNIDVNLDIIWGESTQKINTSYMLDNTDFIKLYGVTVKKLSPVMEFISLCMHHYKDMNSIYLLVNGSLKLNLFCDIYYYLKNSNIDFFGLMEACNYLDITEYVCYCIYYTDLLFDDDITKKYTCNITRTEKFNKILTTFGLDNKERQPWKYDFFQRIFDSDIPNLLYYNLSESEKEKVKINGMMMNMN